MILDRIPYVKKLLKKIQAQQAYIDSLEAQFDMHKGDPITVVNQLTEGDFQWYDYNELPADQRLNYYKQARMILEADVFDNEIQRLNQEFAEWSAKQSRDFDGVLAMRHQISGINLLKERFENITDPTVKETPPEDPYSGI